jgi:alpha amylase-like protein
MENLKAHPLLYQFNTRVVLNEIGRQLQRTATLDDLSDQWLDEVAESGFDVLWPLGVWRTSAASRQVSLADPQLRREAAQALPDLTDADIAGSPFAISAYEVRAEWGGSKALERLRRRLAQRGVRLLLDFVPNHTGLEHAWLDEHPEYYIHGSEEDLVREPHNYVRVRSRGQLIVLAHGRDPYFAGWPDTLQLDYRHAGLRRAMRDQLVRIAAMCDGVRCDMAMLVQPDVFARTWHDRGAPADGSQAVRAPFWPDVIADVGQTHPGFVFMAEVYWGREWELQQEGFDYTYDKTLYDRLSEGQGHLVREHLLAEPTFQRRCARFVENHDEPRAAATFPLEVHRPAAIITFLTPGLRFFHEGQLDGRRTRVSMHVARRPDEPADPRLRQFYSLLLPCLRRPEVHEGDWSLWVCRAAWAGNESWRDMIVTTWVQGERRLLIAVNFAPHPGQCYVTIDLPGTAGRRLTLRDLLGATRYEREADGMRQNGLYLDLPAWGHHVFEVQG